jgi:hypothetical protein
VVKVQDIVLNWHDGGHLEVTKNFRRKGVTRRFFEQSKALCALLDLRLELETPVLVTLKQTDQYFSVALVIVIADDHTVGLLHAPQSPIRGPPHELVKGDAKVAYFVIFLHLVVVFLSVSCILSKNKQIFTPISTSPEDGLDHLVCCHLLVVIRTV